jgi:hypothetical protein
MAIWRMVQTVWMASRREAEGNPQIATPNAGGRAFRQTVAAVIIPSVPSEPMNSSVKLYPALDFLHKSVGI